MTDGDDSEELPDDPNALYELATSESTFPYEREAAIKKLAALEADDRLTALAEDAALTPIERTLAETKLEERDS